jgi:hypothetical protein
MIKEDAPGLPPLWKKFYPVHPTEKTVLGRKAYRSPLDKAAGEIVERFGERIPNR